MSAWSALVAALSSIIVSELGDKTFFIAAIMAMRYNRIAVFIGAAFALVLMTGISTAFGWVFPALLPPQFTQIAVTVLFFCFGGKLLYDVFYDDGKEKEEAAQVQAQLDEVHSMLVMQKKQQAANAAKKENPETELGNPQADPEMQIEFKEDPENPCYSIYQC